MTINNDETIKSFDEAIYLTMKKYGYGEREKKIIYEKLEKGNFNCITSDNGARKFVQQYYANLQKQKTPNSFKDFKSLNKFFDHVLQKQGIPKERTVAFQVLYNELVNEMKNQNNQLDIEKLIVDSACLYYKEKMTQPQITRKFDFSTPDITRIEAVELTNIYQNMEHQKYQVKNAFYTYPGYQKALLQNLIHYSYYEHPFEKNLEDQINEVKSSKR